MSTIQLDGGGEIQPSPDVDAIGVLYPGERLDIILVSSIDVDEGFKLIVKLDQE